MKNMRDIIALMEAPVIDAQNAEMQGTMDIRGLLALLPGVQDQERFTTALRKIMRGQTDNINRQEAMQLAYAFVSLIQADAATKTKITTKMRTAHGEAEPEQA